MQRLPSPHDVYPDPFSIAIADYVRLGPSVKYLPAVEYPYVWSYNYPTNLYSLIEIYTNKIICVIDPDSLRIEPLEYIVARIANYILMHQDLNFPWRSHTP